MVGWRGRRRAALAAAVVAGVWALGVGGGAAVAADGAGAPAAAVAEGGAAAPTPAAAAGAKAGGEAAEMDGEALARRYRRSGEAVALERQGEALVPFGHGRPVVRCAPLRACAVELEAGEVVLATSSGDSERWLVQTAAAGSGGGTPLVVVKPTGCDLATNLLVATNRRVYELALESPPCGGRAEGEGAAGGKGGYNPRLPYTGLLRFYYPDDLVKRWAGEEEAAARQAAREAAGRVEMGPAARLARLNFDYEWRRDLGYGWTPRQVFDDGERTYIVVPVAARWGEAPVLFELRGDGTTALLNYRVEGETYVADRVVERVVLMGGTGGKKAAARLEITNRGFGGGRGRGR
jgi:type IV secretion system protein TrbG